MHSAAGGKKVDRRTDLQLVDLLTKVSFKMKFCKRCNKNRAHFENFSTRNTEKILEHDECSMVELRTGNAKKDSNHILYVKDLTESLLEQAIFSEKEDFALCTEQ